MNKTTKESLIREAKERIDKLHRNRTTPVSRNGYHSLITDLISQAHTAGRQERTAEVFSGEPLCTLCPECEEKIYVPTIPSDSQLLDKAEKMSQSASYWEEKYNNQKQELLEMVEGMRKELPILGAQSADDMMEEEVHRGYNQALKDIKNHLTNE